MSGLQLCLGQGGDQLGQMTKQRPPHLLPGQSAACHAQLLAESRLESWQEEIARGGAFSAEKLAALAVVLGLLLSQLSLVTPPAGASGVAPTALDDAYVVDEGGSSSTVGGIWHLPGWHLRRSITFDNTGRGQLDSFPVLVRLDPADIDYTRTLGSGQDLRFVDSDGTPLDYEIEDWNSGGVSFVWVRVPQIDAGSTTDSIWMYYDNDSASHAQNAAGVWSNGYVGVWHMDQDPGVSQILDSTAYLNHGTAFNMDGSNLQPGAIGDGLSFPGTVPNPDYIRIPSDGTDELSIAGTQLTLEAWAQQTGDNGTWSIIVARQLGTGGSDSFALFGDQSSPDRVSIVGPDNMTGDPGSLPLNQWRYVAGVRDGTNLTLYSAGSQVGQFTGLGSSIATDVNDVTIGAEENGPTADPTEAWLGMLDEVRISSVARSVDWITAQNASMTDTFAAFGTEEEAGVLANDTDPESDPLTASLDAGPRHAATFTLNADGSFDYTPAAGMSGTDSFTYVANDGTGNSNVATVTITVTATGPNSPPVAADDPSAVTPQDVAVAVDVLANDTDPDPDGLTVSMVTQGSNGSVVNNGTDVTYTPDPGWAGVDTFTYEASDSNGGFDIGTVTVTVNAAPVAAPGGPYLTDEGEDLILDGSGSTDPETDPLTYDWDIDNDGQYDDATGVNPTVPWLTLVGLGFDDDGGPYPIGLEVDDGNGNTDTATVNWSIANTQPSVSITGSGSVGAGSVYTANLSVTDPGDDTVNAWTINWGDGTIDSIPGNPASATHTYANPGEYNITAAVADEDSLPNLPWHNDRMVVPGLFSGQQFFRLEATSGAVIDNLATGSGQGWALTAIIGPDGLAYVGDYTGDSIRRYNPVTGADLGVWIAAGTGGLNGPAGMQFGPDGHLYVSSNFGDQILEFDTDGTFLGVFASGGGLDEPDDLIFGPDGHLYVTSFNTDEVLKFNGRDGNPMGVFASGPEMNQPSELVFDSNGRLYVTSVANDHVARYNANGTFDTIFAVAGATGLNEPRAATFGPDGHLYVGGRNRIVRYDGASGALIDVYLASGSISGPSQSAFIPAHQVSALPLIVNSTGDASDSTPGDGVCHTGGTNSATAPECTLRAAIEEANAFPGTDTINFDMPATEGGHVGGVWTISPGSAFDQIIETVIIDGRTQPGWSTTPVVESLGTLAGAFTHGFEVAGDNSEIRGIAITGFGGNGIRVLSGASDTIIAGNHIGTDPSGTIDRGNGFAGIRLMSGSGSTRVGGMAVADRNLVSGNDSNGMVVYESDGNTIIGNYFGTDVTGNAPLPNDQDGIYVGGTSSNNIIGQPGAGNVLSGNSDDGLELHGNLTGNVIHANIVGLGADGTTAVANARHGVVIYDGVSNTQIGGTGAGEGNVVSGNTVNGITLDGNGGLTTANNTVAGNLIGTDAAGLLGRGNGEAGVLIFGGANTNTVGGATAGHRNVISGNGIDGIRIEGSTSSGNRIESNHIGTNLAGTAAVPNGNNGIYLVGAPNNTIGGVTANHRNVISGNGNNGILLDGATATLNSIQGNYVGLNASGDAAVPNADEGVDLSDAPNNTVGGAGVGAGNIISGNGQDGLLLIGNLTSGNEVSGNYIGTNASGNAAVPNGRVGVNIDNAASGNTVGGATVGHRNVISGNTEDGVYITDLGSDGNTLAGNYIGTNAAGDAAVPNGDRGVQIESGASGNFIGITGSGNVISGNTGDGVIVADWTLAGTTDNEVVDNLIGVAADGTTPLGNGANGVHLDPVADTLIQGNTIAHNGADGVILEPATLTGNSIVGNSIYSNGQLGIDLGNDGVTGNDGGDGDLGPNHLLNFPNMTSAAESGGTVTVDFDLDVPAGSYRIEFFANPSGADPSGNGEGETFVGFYNVLAHPGGLAAYSTTFSGSVGDILTATATAGTVAPFGSTSEFSSAMTVTLLDTPPVITLLGANPQTIEAGSPYVELGATALDDVDGDITGSIVIDATAVNTSALGSYVVTYNVSDSAGNPAVEVTRTVDVVDTTAPAITLVGANPQVIEAGSPYVELGATATDNYDGDLTGSIVINATAVNTAVVGSYSVTYDVTDTSGNAATQVVRTVDVVNPPPPNGAPTLGALTNQAGPEGSLIAFTATASDPDPLDTLLFGLVGEPSGAAIDPVSGDFSWTPTEAQGPGVYVFDVVVTDDGSPSESDSASMTVTVAEDNSAPTVTNPGPQFSAEGDAVSLGIGAGDSDDPVNTLSYAASGLPPGLTIDPGTGLISGVLDFNASGGSPYTATITVTDNGVPAASGQAMFTWTVGDVNRAPVGADDAYTINEDASGVFDVLTNDNDPDGDAVTVTGVGLPAHGVATVLGNSIRYVPDRDYFGPDSFTYTVGDGRGGFAGATATVTVIGVNDVPVVTAPTAMTVSELNPVSFDVVAVDVEGDALSYALAGAPTGASIDSAGTFYWVPGEAHGPGSYLIDVVVGDDGTPVRATTHTVTIDVTELNAPPNLSNPGTQSSTEADAVNLGLAAYDSDLPVSILHFSATGLPPGLSINSATGIISGTIAHDAAAGSPYATTVTVYDDGIPPAHDQVTFSWIVAETNWPPVAVDMTVEATAGVPVVIALSANDPDGDAITYAVATAPTQGSLAGGPRVLTYTPDVAAAGLDSFTFSVSDGDAVDTGTVTISIAPNRVPIGIGDEYVVRRGGILVVDAPGVLGNDRDPEGQPLDAVIASLPSHGSVTLGADGTFTYENHGDNADIDSFTYRVGDGMRTSAPTTVRIVIEENVAPVAGNDMVGVDEDEQVSFRPLDNDTDANNEPVVVVGVADAAHGSVRWTPDGVFTYAPDPNWNGVESFDYVISDGDLTGTGVVTVVVSPVNDPPRADTVVAKGDSGERLVVDLNSYVYDVDGDAITFLLEAPPQGNAEQIEPGVFAFDLDGVIRDLPALAFIATDVHGAHGTALLKISIEIPADLVGVPALVGDDVRLAAASDMILGSAPQDGEGSLVAGLRLMIGSVLGTFQAIRIPVLVLLAILLGSLYLGFTRRFVFSNTATALPLGSKRRVDVVMAQSRAGIPARDDPGSHQHIVARFGPDETGITTTGARSMVRSELWVEVETPEQDAWVNASFLTEQQPRASFADDERTRHLVAEMVDQLEAGGDLLPMTGGHDLHVAFFGPPVRFAAGSLRRLLSGASVFWWWGADGDAPSIQATFAEIVGGSIAAAYRNRGTHRLEPTFPVPIEFANMHSLVVGDHERGEAWRVFFRYEDDEPQIAGLMREAPLNPAAMHGMMVREDLGKR